MKKAGYWQRGEALDYKNETPSMIEAGTIVALQTRIGVVGAEIPPGGTGSLHVSGVFEMEKGAAEELAMGDPVYFNGVDATKMAEGNTPVGYAAAPAKAADGTVLVKLQG